MKKLQDIPTVKPLLMHSGLDFNLDIGVNEIDPFTGDTALIYALKKDHRELTITLLQNGALASIKNKSGISPIMVVNVNLRGGWMGDIITKLHSTGANLADKDLDNGNTILDKILDNPYPYFHYSTFMDMELSANLFPSDSNLFALVGRNFPHLAASIYESVQSESLNNLNNIKRQSSEILRSYYSISAGHAFPQTVASIVSDYLSTDYDVTKMVKFSAKNRSEEFWKKLFDYGFICFSYLDANKKRYEDMLQKEKLQQAKAAAAASNLVQSRNSLKF